MQTAPTSSMATPSLAMLRLIATFRDNLSDYLNPEYNEEQTRADFFTPMFVALGWDVANIDGVPQKYRDVLHEALIKIGDTHKSPDYSFRIEGQRKFFFEAKKPSVDIRKDAGAAFQIRRYGWSAGMSLCVLSNFRTFAVYDCRYEPKASDGATVALVLTLDHSEYESRWAEIAALFSRHAVAAGSLDVYAEEVKAARGARRVDEAFLAEIEYWREILADNIKSLNPKITVVDLNFAVQATIDRIIFLRMCEDRGIEPYGQLQGIGGGPRVYERLLRLYIKADDRYNSGLFHFKEEKDRSETHDPITPTLKIDDAPLQEIIKRIYFPVSPYAFQYLDPHILGQVYEQFLGKVIVIRAGKALVEEKPEVRKAGGVYYTPISIVDYIVKQTVGKLLEGKLPAQVQNIRIVDPACGSGSFLLGAFRFLLAWYRERYVEELAVKTSRRLFKDAAGDWRLTIDARKRILLTHIYGVDIDLQAVEVTKLSLLLTLLEGESSQSVSHQLLMFHERALPDLGNNVKCGNSLIGDDYYKDEQFALFPTKREVNTFDWHRAFPRVFSGKRDGGFHAVIGNPPYIDSELMTQYLANWRAYCTKHYQAASGNWDLYCVFIEKSMQILRFGGLASLIVPNKLGSADYAAGARRALAENNTLLSVRDYSAVKVFPVAVYPIIYVATRQRTAQRQPVYYERMTAAGSGVVNGSHGRNLDFDACFSDPARPWRMFAESDLPNPFERLRGSCPPLETVAKVLGAATVQEAYEIKPLISEMKGSGSGLRFINSGLIDRYGTRWSVRPCRYIKDAYECPVVTATAARRLPPKRLEQGRTPKLIIAGMTRVIECFVDAAGEWLAGKSTTIVLDSALDLRYLAALINSKLIAYYFFTEYGGNRLQGGYLRIGPPQVRTIPIHVPNLKNRGEQQNYNALLGLVDAMITVQGQLQAANTPHARHHFENDAAGLDTKIDAMVYRIYGISDIEIETVERAYKAAVGGPASDEPQDD